MADGALTKMLDAHRHADDPGLTATRGIEHVERSQPHSPAGDHGNLKTERSHAVADDTGVRAAVEHRRAAPRGVRAVRHTASPLLPRQGKAPVEASREGSVGLTMLALFIGAAAVLTGIFRWLA